MKRSLAEIVAPPPARPEDFRLSFSEDEIRTLDRALRSAIWTLNACAPWKLRQRFEALVRKIEERP